MNERAGLFTAACLVFAFGVAVSPAEAKKKAPPPAAVEKKQQFTYDEKVNAQMAKKLSIPVFFAVPASARAALPTEFNTTDGLIDFKHPDAAGSQGDVGLRLVVTKRAGMTKRLGKSG